MIHITLLHVSRHKSSSAYSHLRESGVLSLPSQRTLRDYTHYISTGAGFSAATDQQLLEHANVNRLGEWEKFVVLILDEMHIRDELVYDKHAGNLVGFTDLGEVNHHLERLEWSVRESDTADQTATLATSMLVMMVGFAWV